MPLSEKSIEYIGSRVRNLGPILIGILGDALVPDEAITDLEADLLFEIAIRELYTTGTERLTTDKVEAYSQDFAGFLINNNPKYEQYSSNPVELVRLFKRAFNSLSRDGGYKKVEKLMLSLHDTPDALEVRSYVEEIAEEVKLRRAGKAGE